MGFFLVGRSRDGEGLRLVADTEFPTRQDALDTLAEVAVDPALESEVFVVDLDAATPVLLVPRPQQVASPMGVAAAEPEVPEEPPAEPEVPEEPPTEAALPAEATPPELPTEPATEPAEEPATEPVEEHAIADAIIADMASEEGADVPPRADEQPLSEALRRATGAMEAEGIVAPESIGPEAPATPAAAAAEAGWPWTPGDEPAGETAVEPEAVVEPEPTAPEPAPEPVPEPNAPEEPEPNAPEAYVPDALEEPAVTEEPLLPSTDEGAFELSRPVVMGAYPEEAPPPSPEPASPEATPADAGGILADLEIDIPPAPPVATQPPTVSEAPVEPMPEPAAAPVYEPGDTDLSGLTCDDCVYVNTCPNKDERDPASCGSFQWKSS